MHTLFEKKLFQADDIASKRTRKTTQRRRRRRWMEQFISMAYSPWLRDRSRIYFQGLFRVVCILFSRYWLRHRAEARHGSEDGCLWSSPPVVSSRATPRPRDPCNIFLIVSLVISFNEDIFLPLSYRCSIKALGYFASRAYWHLESFESGLFHGNMKMMEWKLSYSKWE